MFFFHFYEKLELCQIKCERCVISSIEEILTLNATNLYYVFTSHLCATPGGRFREYAILITAYTRHRHWYCIIVRGICAAKNICFHCPVVKMPFYQAKYLLLHVC